jgi:hypothetical protein
MRTRLLPAALVFLLSLGFAACGGGSDVGSSSATVSGGGPSTARTHDGVSERPAVAPLRISGGGSAQFRVDGGDNSIQNYGAEAGADDLAAAAKVVHRYLVARAEHKWRVGCTYLAPRLVSQLAAAAPQLEGQGCAAVLAALTAGVSASAAWELTVIDAASLRYEGDQAFLLYRGGGNAGYFAALTKQNGIWRVSAFNPTPFP